ncbi:calcium-binding protein [Solirubrobacter phytolaccae]|uniref:Calcium-binding protein n=1 Tax=Solirubrobacter phytolaccae TaxID=1404360 RepID=A0A9X3NAB4_9ACTN|nr:calcium-binding protein [Solirubrobacter phytolaccae]MDA0182459.1 calcium-binding protein [Solirubrobacter phytolaccae]
MKWLGCVLALLLVAPATAQAGTLAREGTELVYRSAPEQADAFLATVDRGALVVQGRGITPGEGCGGTVIRCSLDGITGLRVFAGDGNDELQIKGSLALAVDLGPGDDVLNFTAPAAVVSAGDGRDRVDSFNSEHYVGPFQLDGGPGDDTLIQAGRGPGMTLIGGDGNDTLGVLLVGIDGYAVDLVCGAGEDRTIGEPQDRLGEGCATALTDVTSPRRVSRTFREGRLATPARVTVTLRRRIPGSGSLEQAVIARRTFSAPAGPLRAQLRTTAAGRRWLRRDPKLPVFVRVQTRTRSERAEVWFESRLG